MRSSSRSDKERAPSRRWWTGHLRAPPHQTIISAAAATICSKPDASTHPFCFSSFPFFFPARCRLLSQLEVGNTRGSLSPFQFFNPKLSLNRSINILAQLFAGGSSMYRTYIHIRTYIYISNACTPVCPNELNKTPYALHIPSRKFKHVVGFCCLYKYFPPPPPLHPNPPPPILPKKLVIPFL